ncbi:unnamed protein product [Rotaria sordida]|uniref:THAP9-like helix-turn-helix domain-containing protein n=1 Tax=Rotaria sordida TaxID=392033 RepID=A0A816C9J3_9BILA|nr:unnamed protein product [Rotaria sordida]
MNKKDVYDVSVLPDNIFTLKGEEFFHAIRSLVGEVICNILQIQMIDSAQNFLNTVDVFEIFKYDSEEIDNIKTKSCFKMRNGEYIIRTGVLNNMTYLKTILKKKIEEQHSFTNDLQKERYYELIDQNSMLQSLIDWYSQNQFTNNYSNKKHLFVSSFIDTITKNIVKSKQGYRYDDSVKDFALVLYILGGKQCYDFIRINIIGALPNLTTINKLISNADSILTEGQFRFAALKEYLDTVNVRFGFCAEDCTGVIKKVKYDVTTNSFIGFVTKLSNGVPIRDCYQTDSFEQLTFWFDNIEKASLLNIHMFQPIPQSNQANAPASFLISAYGVDSTSTAIDIINRWIYLFNNCIQNQIRIIGFSTGKIFASKFSS